MLNISKVIAVSNQKGGVGKTTTTCALAAALAKRGQRVLCVDMDPQGNLSYTMGGKSEDVPTAYELLKGQTTAKDALQKTGFAHLISANILLSGAELTFVGQGREFLLCNALRSVQEDYDYILIDTPPALSILTVNAFTAANSLIIPMLSDIFSLQGITQLYDTVAYVKKHCNPGLEYAGILLTRFAPRTTIAAEIKGTAQMVAKELDIPLFKTCIRSSVAITEAQALQRNIFKYSPGNIASKDYLSLADELLQREDEHNLLEGYLYGK